MSLCILPVSYVQLNINTGDSFKIEVKFFLRFIKKNKGYYVTVKTQI